MDIDAIREDARDDAYAQTHTHVHVYDAYAHMDAIDAREHIACMCDIMRTDDTYAEMYNASDVDAMCDAWTCAYADAMREYGIDVDADVDTDGMDISALHDYVYTRITDAQR